MLDFFRPLSRKSDLIVTSPDYQIYFVELVQSRDWTFVQGIDLIYALNENIELEIQNQKFALVPGQLLLLTRGCCYKLSSLEKDASRFVQLSYSKKNYLSIESENHFSAFDVDCDELKGFIVNHCMSILKAVENSEDKNLIEEKVFSLIESRLQHFFSSNYLCLENLLEPMKNKELLEKVLLNFEKKLHKFNVIQSVAENLSVSREHLSRKFKTTMQILPRHFFKLMKLRKSQFLLPSSEKIYNVSFDLGFSDQSHFNKTFQKHLGMSPSDFKLGEKNDV